MNKLNTKHLKKVDLEPYNDPKISPMEKMKSLQKPGKRKKKSKLQKKRDNPKSTLWKNKSMALWGRVMHQTYKTCLINNGCKGNLEAHHLITRSRVLTRNDINNGVMLCSLHHKFSTELSAHMAPIQFAEYLRENHPDKIEYVMNNRYKTGKPDYKHDFDTLTELLETQ